MAPAVPGAPAPPPPGAYGSGQPPAPWAAAPAKPDPTFAWTLAFAPLLIAFVPLVIPNLSDYDGVMAAIALNVVLWLFDRNRLAKAGININSAWVLLVPGYLIVRTIRAHSTPAIPVVWFVTFFASFAVPVLIPAAAGPVTMDSIKLEHQLSRSIRQQTGTPATVTCLSNPRVPVNGTFTCTARDSTGSAHVIVTVTDSDGRYRWQLAP